MRHPHNKWLHKLRCPFRNPSPPRALSLRFQMLWRCPSPALLRSPLPPLVRSHQMYATVAAYTAAAVSAPPAQPSVASFAALAYPTPPVAKTASALTQFNKLPPKPAAHAVPLKAPAAVAAYQPPPVMNAAPPAAPTVAAAPATASVALQAVSGSGAQQLSQAELLADEKCWQKLEQMRAKFESPLRTIYESLLKQGRDDVNLVPVQKMVRWERYWRRCRLTLRRSNSLTRRARADRSGASRISKRRSRRCGNTLSGCIRRLRGASGAFADTCSDRRLPRLRVRHRGLQLQRRRWVTSRRCSRRLRSSIRRCTITTPPEVRALC